jgi:L-threonylcarbamoyladenylate synthase
MNAAPAESNPAARVVAATDDGVVAAAAAALRRGAIVALPTDTVYGIAADLHRPEAIERLYRVKGRPESKAIPILLADASDVDLAVLEMPLPARALARRFWPGGLTLVVPGRPGLPGPVTSSDERGQETVAVRVPDHPVTRAIIRAAGGALAVTSANRSGDAPALDAGPLASLPLLPTDLIVDGGPTPGDKASTIVAITGEKVAILRKGAVSAAEIAAALSGDDAARIPRGAV